MSGESLTAVPPKPLSQWEPGRQFLRPERMGLTKEELDHLAAGGALPCRRADEIAALATLHYRTLLATEPRGNA